MEFQDNEFCAGEYGPIAGRRRGKRMLHRPGVAESTPSENDPHRHRSADICSGAKHAPQGNDLRRPIANCKNHTKLTCRSALRIILFVWFALQVYVLRTGKSVSY